MAFNDEVVKDGRGRFLRLDVFIAGVITYRWGTVAGLLDGTNQYEPVVLTIGTLKRGFGMERVVGSSGLDLVLDNTTGAANWLMSLVAPNDMPKARFKLYIGLYDRTVGVSGAVTKQLGEFVVGDFPTRDAGKVKLQLVDDVLGALANPMSLPTFGDWAAVGDNTNNPLKAFGDLYWIGANPEMQMQLAWGEDWVKARITGRPGNVSGSTYTLARPAVICVTTNDDAVTGHDVTRVRIIGKGDKRAFDVGSTYRSYLTQNIETLWSVEKSPAISKGGKNWYVVYLLVNLGPWYQWYFDQYGQGPGGPSVVVANGHLLDPAFDSVDWYVKGYPLSAVTNQGSAAQHATDVIRDFIAYYTAELDDSYLDEDAFAAVKNLTPWNRVAGVISPGEDQSEDIKAKQRTMRQEVTRLCQSSDIDLFTNWEGKFAVATDLVGYDELTGSAAFEAQDETRLKQVADYRPSEGQRGFPANRIFTEGGRADRAEMLGPPYQGPYDYAAGITAAGGRVYERFLQIGWLTQERQSQDGWGTRTIDSKFRPRIRFQTDISGLRYELGQSILVTWSTGGYSNTIFKVESLSYSQVDDRVEVDAIWADFLTFGNPYLLDNETLPLLATGSGGRTATVTDDDTLVAFSSGNLTSDGVLPGDILILRDATQGAVIFSRNRALRILQVIGATTLEIDDPDLDFDTPGGSAVSAWTIVRGATTYDQLETDDPSNYPVGDSALYGKVTDDVENFSDSSNGNQVS